MHSNKQTRDISLDIIDKSQNFIIFNIKILKYAWNFD